MGLGRKNFPTSEKKLSSSNREGKALDYTETDGQLRGGHSHSRTHSRKGSRTSAASYATGAHTTQGSPWLTRPDGSGGADKVLRVPGGHTHSRHGSVHSSLHGGHSRRGSRHGSTRATPVLVDPSGPSVSVSPLRDGERDTLDDGKNQTEWGAHRGLLGKDWDLIMKDLDI